ncbi:hypothetical protein BX600DRAFT_517939 [Xylariales sp. PMI_506]|nr:hypothetical protein BX600DRAFT_517939 [Xylariales sp. PMI_506]
MAPTIASPLSFSTLLTALAALLLLLPAATHARPYNAIAPFPMNYWNPTAGLFYHRCSSPTGVEVSKDQETWHASAICMRGTCCATLSKGPLCSIANCELAEKELRTSEKNFEKMKALDPDKKPGSKRDDVGGVEGYKEEEATPARAAAADARGLDEADLP